MFCSEGICFGEGLCSQHERDRIVVRRVDAAVYVARTRPQWPANERPINPAAPFKQAICMCLRRTLRASPLKSCMGRSFMAITLCGRGNKVYGTEARYNFGTTEREKRWFAAP
jgi:hypothetical protein